MLLVGLQHGGNILGKVLAVGIQSDGIGEAHLQSLLETSLQGAALAAILGTGNDGDSLDALQDVECLVGTSVCDNNHIEAVFEGTTDHIGNGSGIVISRNHYADASVAKCLLSFH